MASIKVRVRVGDGTVSFVWEAVQHLWPKARGVLRDMAGSNTGIEGEGDSIINICTRARKDFAVVLWVLRNVSIAHVAARGEDVVP